MRPPSKPLSRHGQIQNGLRALAKTDDMTVNEVYSRFFREVFLAELMDRDKAWVLKGGTNLHCLINQARYTKDLDLYRQSDPKDHLRAAEELVELMDGARVGPYTFVLELIYDKTIQGTIPNTNVKVDVKAGVTRFSGFSVDVSGELIAPLVTKQILVRRTDNLDIQGIPSQFAVNSYPVENQLADKVCAIFERHGARSTPSTRYRDLYDSGLITLNLDLRHDDLKTALRTQEALRQITLDPSLSWPSEDWPDHYEKFVSTVRSAPPELLRAEQTRALVAEVVGPVLNGDGNAPNLIWRAQLRQWVEPSD